MRIVLAAALLFASAPAAAASRSFEKAKEAYEQLEYQRVTPLLKKALKESTDAAEQVLIYEMLATMDVMYGNDSEAIDDFIEVLSRDASYVLPGNASPKLRDAFNSAQAELERMRSDAAPQTLKPSGPSPTVSAGPAAPFYEKWWFWTAAGAVVVLTGGVIVWQLSRPRYPEADFGPFPLSR